MTLLDTRHLVFLSATPPYSLGRVSNETQKFPPVFLCSLTWIIGVETKNKKICWENHEKIIFFQNYAWTPFFIKGLGTTLCLNGRSSKTVWATGLGLVPMFLKLNFTSYMDLFKTLKIQIWAWVKSNYAIGAKNMWKSTRFLFKQP